MKTHEITNEAKKAIESRKYDVIRINYPSPDMVGHTGDLKATINALEYLDKHLVDLIDCVDKNNGMWLITADHGNCEDMAQRQKKTNKPIYDDQGKVIPLTSHTLNPVGVFIGGSGLAQSIKFKPELEKKFDGYGLANVTATYINMLGLQAPDFYKPTLLA